MSYRDESIVLRERLLSLEAEHAKLEGTAAGIRFRTEEAEDEAKRLKRLIGLEKTKRSARRAAFRTLGLVGGLALLVTVCFLAVFFFHACTNVSGTFEARDAYRGTESLEGCQLSLNDAFLSDCEVRAWCDDGLVFEGPGECQRGLQGDEFWAHGESSFVFVRGVRRAVYRPHEGEVVVFRFEVRER